MAPKAKFRKVEISYPPVPTRKWRPPRSEHVPQPFKRKPLTRLPLYPKTLVTHPTTLEKIWHQYRITPNGCAILYGQYSQNDMRFPLKDRGKQGPANCFVAIGLTKILGMDKWHMNTISKVLEIGEQLYRTSIAINKLTCSCTTPKEVHNTFFIDHVLIVLGQDPKAITGPINDEESDNGLKYYLKKVLRISPYCILEMNGKFMAIWKAGGCYYVFDPNDRTFQGYKCRDGYGVAVIMKFLSYKKLVDDCLFNYGSSTDKCTIPGFTITAIHIKKVNETDLHPPEFLEDYIPSPKDATKTIIDSCLMTKLPKTEPPKELNAVPPAPPLPGPPAKKKKHRKPKPPPVSLEPERESNTPSFNAIYDIGRIEESIDVVPVLKPKSPSVTYFKEVVPKRVAIIRASLHQNDPEFSRHFGKQGLANAVAALAMLRIHKTKYWFPKILDDILITGETIFRESYKSFSGDQTLTLKNMVKKFKLSRFYFQPEIEETTVVGKMNSAKMNILDLLPALEEFFSEYDTGMIRGPLIIAVWMEEGKYYMFDPNERNSKGCAVPKAVKMGDNDEPCMPQGVACVTWFVRLKDLVSLYMDNLDKSQRRDHFFISRVEIKDYIDLPEKWFNFTPLREGKWILRGTFSQNNTRFAAVSRNIQCTAISTLAVVYNKLKNVKLWDRETVDYVIIEGDVFYNKCVEYLKQKGRFQNKMLMMCEILDNYCLEEKDVLIQIEECLVNGILEAPDNFEFPNLRIGIENFFKDNDGGVITSKGLSIGIWKEEDAYFYFDSHARGPRGYDDYAGTSCILRVLTIEELARIINANLGVGAEEVYNIARVDACVRLKTADGVIKPDFHFYKELSPKKGIIRASTFQGDTERFDINADKQTFANLLIALGMATLFPSNLWDKLSVEEILKLGDKLYTDSRTEYIKQDLLNMSSWESQEPKNLDLINHENVLKEFKIGVNKVTIEIGEIMEGVFELELRRFKRKNEEQITVNGLQTVLFNAVEVVSEDENSKNEIIIDCDLLSLAIWKDEGLYYVFDPKGKDAEGNFFGRDLWSAKIIIQDEGEDYGEEYFGKRDSMAGGDASRKGSTKPEVDDTFIDEFGEECETEEAYLERLKVKPIDVSDSKACTIMFTTFDDLYNHIIENVPPNKRSEMFKMYPIKIITEPELKEITNPEDKALGNWFNFIEIEKDHWILRATINLHNQIFPDANKGKQYASMCIAACSYGRLYALPKYESWTVDHILKYGDKLHTAVRKMREKELRANKKELGLSEEEIQMIGSNLQIRPCESLSQFYMGNFLVMCTVNPDIVEGDVTKDWLPKVNPNVPSPKGADAMSVTSDTKGRKRGGQQKEEKKEEKKEDKKGKKGKKDDVASLTSTKSPAVIEDPAANVLGLQAGISKFFEEEHQYGILSAKGKCVSLWKLFEFYYLFDPESRGPNGIDEVNGRACIIRYAEVGKLIDTIDQNLQKERGGNNKYTIDEVLIRSKEGKRPEPEVTKVISKDPKITAFNEIAPGKMILRGNFHQDHVKFGVPKNACGAANGIVALAMAQIHKAATWTKLIVDEVITNGYRLYKKSLMKLGCDFNNWDDRLVLDLVNTDFNLGIKQIDWVRNVDEIKKGLLKIKSTNILSLRRGLEDFFIDFNYGVIECDLLTTAVWLDNELYYMFDPNPRGPTGIFTTGGRASLIVFKSITMMADHFLKNVPEEYHCFEYRLTPVDIAINDKKDERKPLKKMEILKITDIDSLASNPKRPVTSKSKTPSKHVNIEISCEQNKATNESKKYACYCPQKGDVIVRRKERCDLIELSPEEKKEWARQKSQDKKLKQLLMMEHCMRKEFYTLENGDAILRAKYSQNSDRFSSLTRNNQSLPNSLVALVMLRIHDPNTWSHANIEIVLDSGDVLYKDSFVLFKPSNPKLGLRNVLRTFYILNLKITTVIYKPCLAGNCIYKDVFKALLNFFMQDNAAIISADSLTVAVYQKSGQYFMFDPHDRNTAGNRCSKGAACLLRFENLENLVEKYILNSDDPEDKFTVCAIKVQGVKKSDK